MLDSWHNFFFVSFDPLGLVTRRQAAARAVGRRREREAVRLLPAQPAAAEALMRSSPCRRRLPVVLARRFGVAAALIAGVAMAVFPSFVAVSRANGVDALLILLLVLACAAGDPRLRIGRLALACSPRPCWSGSPSTRRPSPPTWPCPRSRFAYLVCAPARLPRRLLQLLSPARVMGVVSFAWIAAVEATPASQRPYVGSSTNNTELGLTFEYNGFGRVEGQAGGPGQTQGKPGARVPLHDEQHRRRGARAAPPLPSPCRPEAVPALEAHKGRERRPDPVRRLRPAPFRLFGARPRRPGRLDPAVRFRRPARGAAAVAGSRRARAEAEEAGLAPGRRRRADGATPGSQRPRARRLAARSRPSCSRPRRGSCTPTTSRRSRPAPGAMTGIGAWTLWRLCGRPRSARSGLCWPPRRSPRPSPARSC